MEVASLQQQQHLSDSFSHGWLNRSAQADPGIGYSFGSSSRSFIDMDPSDLFSMRWTTPTDFHFVLPESGDPTSPVLASATQVFRLIPCEPGGCSGAPEDGVDESESAGRLMDMPMFYSAQSTPCSSAMSGNGKHAMARPVLVGRRGGSPWKVLLRYLRFLMPMCRRPARSTNRVSPASPARRSTSSSMEWCHGNVDTAVDDAILYCKKSRGKEVLA